MIFLNLDDVFEVINCNDINSSQIRRFTKSPVFANLERYKINNDPFNNFVPSSVEFIDFKNKDQYPVYIIAVGVTHSPWDWCGCNDLEIKYQTMAERNTIFYSLDKKAADDIRKGKAFLLLDQSHEGYHADWLFDWFYSCFEKYNIPPKQVIYVTGNLGVEDQYNNWVKENNPEERMFVIPHIQFEEFISDSARAQKDLLPSVDEHISYKKENKDKIKTYNCFQKRARPHRIWMFNELFKNDLLKDGINSMNSFDAKNSFYEGRWVNEDDYKAYIGLLPIYPRDSLNKKLKQDFEGPLGGSFERDLYHVETRNTWVSVVSEASFAERTCFISEKTFKPIAAKHPFILYGNKNSLKYLRDLGYKTFNGFINETYDELDTWERLEAIIQEIKRIRSMSFEQKLNWYESMRDILDHNYDILKYNSFEKLPDSILKLQKYIRDTSCINT